MNTNRRRNKRSETTDDLNLIPIMNLFVCLLPFLLLSAAFTQFGAVDSELPSSGSEKQEQAQLKDQKQNVELVFEIGNQFVTVTGFKNGFAQAIVGVKARLDIDDPEALEKFIKETKEKYTEVSASLFRVDSGVPYQKAIKVLAQLRRNQELPAITLAAESL